MTKVYLVCDDHNGYDEILGAFTTEEKAQLDAACRRDAYSYNRYYVKEIEVEG